MGKKRVEGKVEASRKRAGSAVEAAQARDAEGTAGEPEEDNRPVRCIESHTNRELRKAFRKVCRGLITQAAAGSTAHTRLLLEIGKSGQRKTGARRGKSLSEMLLDELKRRQDEREAAADKTRAEEQKTNAKADNDEDAASGEGVEKK